MGVECQTHRVSKGIIPNPGDVKYPIKGQTSAGQIFDNKSINALAAWTFPYFSLSKLLVLFSWILHVVAWSFFMNKVLWIIILSSVIILG